MCENVHKYSKTRHGSRVEMFVAMGRMSWLSAPGSNDKSSAQTIEKSEGTGELPTRPNCSAFTAKHSYRILIGFGTVLYHKMNQCHQNTNSTSKMRTFQGSEDI